MGGGFCGRFRGGGLGGLLGVSGGCEGDLGLERVWRCRGRRSLLAMAWMVGCGVREVRLWDL